jgi:hypothetical protein
MIISRLILVRMRNVQIKVVEIIKTHILCSVTFLPPKNLTTYEVMGKNMVQPDRLQMTI